MTFRLRRKHPITPPSTDRWIGSEFAPEPCRHGRRRLIAALSLSLLAGSIWTGSLNTAGAAEPGQQSFLSRTLQKFKNRSAEKRYEQYKAEQPQVSSTEKQSTEPARFSEGASALPAPADEPVVFVLVSQDDDKELSTVPPEPADDFQPDLFHSGPATGAAAVATVETAYQNEDADPRHLKSIRDIQPFHDYQPGTHIEQDLDPEFVAPAEIELGEVSDNLRGHEAILYQWHASNLHHHPLYFQDAGLERYGHVHHDLVQPFVSVGKFGLQLVGLPYQMTIDPICKKEYALGWYSPGECAPKQTYQIPWNSTAALNQAAAVTGLVFAIP